MLCTVCDHAITNPICPKCIGRSIGVWTSETLSDIDIAPHIEETEAECSIECIQCGGSFAICPHCFCKEAYECLHEKLPHAAREFAARFDFELRRELCH